LPLGGQNLIEACAMGKPVLVGPHTFNFAEATAQAVVCGAALRVQDAAELAMLMQQLLTNASRRQAMAAAGLAFSAANRGATERTLSIIEKYLK
jgi:3-deoxy-D-manno-octulosonic-acid transferase